MFVRAVTPQHDHLSDDEEDSDEEMDLPHHHHPIQDLGYTSSRSSSRRRAGQEEDNAAAASNVYRGAQELHHRTTAAAGSRNKNASRITNGTRHVLPTSRTARTNPFRRKRWSSLFRGSVIMGLLGYFILMIRQSWLLTSVEPPSPNLPSLDGMRATRYFFDNKRLEDRRKMLEDVQRRSAERMQRTKPPPSTQQVSQYNILPMEERPQSGQQQQQTNSRLASLQELCGYHAQDASSIHPNSYLSKDALNSKSRVMITGILNPIGFHLALALKERCGVQVMTGIDSMFPNTVHHRLTLQKRIELLTSNIPKLVQPIVLPLVGLDPRLNKNQKNEPSLLPITGEISLLNFRPTHIVHLASYAPDEYMDPLHSKNWNQQSPYVSPERNPDLYRIRSSLASMEQILASIVSADDDDDTQRPHFVYASSSEHYDPVHVSLKAADEVLANIYHSLHNTYSVGVRLPNAVYGPWGRPGSATYQLADAAVANWNSDTSTEGLLEFANLTNATDRVADFLYVSGTYYFFFSSNVKCGCATFSLMHMTFFFHRCRRLNHCGHAVSHRVSIADSL